VFLLLLRPAVTPFVRHYILNILFTKDNVLKFEFRLWKIFRYDVFFALLAGDTRNLGACSLRASKTFNLSKEVSHGKA